MCLQLFFTVMIIFSLLQYWNMQYTTRACCVYCIISHDAILWTLSLFHAYRKLWKVAEKKLWEEGYVIAYATVPLHKFACSEQQNSCLCVILLSCIYCQSICGSVFRILRNKEDLKILCNMGMTWQFANAAKPRRTLILDVLCNMIHCLRSLILEDWNVVKHGGQEEKKWKRGRNK